MIFYIILFFNIIRLFKKFFRLSFEIPSEELCEMILTMSLITFNVVKVVKLLMEDDYQTNKDNQENFMRENSLARYCSIIYK